ncbi:MAG: hypothetical protein L0H96_17785, partial [Humibacillus sp.]|nr:hypothetical protein [Humibacillus sp.]
MREVWSGMWLTFVTLGALVWGVTRWSWRHRGWCLMVAAVVLLVDMAPDRHTSAVLLAVVTWLLPALVSVAWARWLPVSYERHVRGPSLRRGWRRWARRAWPGLSVACGVACYRSVEKTSLWSGKKTLRSRWEGARLMGVETAGSRLQLTVRARVGQTVEDLERIAPAVRDAAAAHSVRTVPIAPGVLMLDLVMRDHLAGPLNAIRPEDVLVDAVPLGRREDGETWLLQVTQRHTLITGCAGAGKGSVFWGIAAGLAPAVSAGLVRLYGIDLKYGLEIETGAALFTTRATTETGAVTVLHRLTDLMESRGQRMSGISRNHTATTAEPLIVLLLDELATLTAYLSDLALRKECGELLSAILSKGRALGIVVVAAIQDPRKETVPMRGLFTQTVALRLRSREEVAMVLRYLSSQVRQLVVRQFLRS